MERERYQPKHAKSNAKETKKSVDASIRQKTGKAGSHEKGSPRKPYTKKTSKKRKGFIAKWKHYNKRQKITVSVAALLLLIILLAVFFVWSKLNKVKTKDDAPMGEQQEEVDIGLMENADAHSLNGVLKSWETNKIKKISDKNVKNILLIGLDPISGCTDTMMLVSVNTKTKVITMASFYRDSYTYYESPKKSGFHKLNAVRAMSGDIGYTIKTIENDYKIEIDNYALVNYDSFKKVIDALGGVDVNVTAREAKFLNETWWDWELNGIEQPKPYVEGMNHLDGEMALIFCRIRKLDSDINRTERQRRVITGIMSSMKNANVTRLNNTLNAVLPYITTDMSKTEMITLAGNAVAGGWLKYEIKQTPVPTEKLCSAGWAGSQWIWICDYEAAAQELQTMLYGTTNIELKPDRTSALDFAS